MSHFLFEGDFKRKPIQSLGGRSRVNEGREVVLRRAQQDRQRRENERARIAATLVFQAAWRARRSRIQLDSIVRAEFKQDVTADYSVDGLHRQMSRINYFFKADRDVQLLVDLGKVMLTMKGAIMKSVMDNVGCLLRLRLILDKALLILSLDHSPARSTVLRMLDTFTNWKELDAVRDGDEAQYRTTEVMGFIWGHLVLEKSFLEKYKRFLRTRLGDVTDPEGAARSLQHFDYTVFYQRFLEVARRLLCYKRRVKNVPVGKKVFSAADLVEIMLRKLAVSVSEGILNKGDRTEDGVLIYVVAPVVAKELDVMLEDDLAVETGLWYNVWLPVVHTLSRELQREADKLPETHGHLRALLFSLLIMIQHNGEWKWCLEKTLPVLNSLMVALDNRAKIFKPVDEDDPVWYGDEDDDYRNDVEMREVEEMERSVDFFKEREKIYTELRAVMSRMTLSEEWVSDGFPSCPQWKYLYDMMSILIDMQPRLVAVHFPFMSKFFNQPYFMNGLYQNVMSREDRSPIELVVMCWLFIQRMNVLHDGEFSRQCFVDMEDLRKLIRLLVEVYTDIVLGDKDVSDGIQSYIKRELAHTLMVIHERNTRIGYFAEETFLSEKFAVMFPMSTHSIRFPDLLGAPTEGSSVQLPLLDQRLLRVLRDFPFALSFHDRVSIWHQILHLDQIDHQITENPMGRQTIQIRRTYIYEDAFEKLSMVNLPDLKADVRITLVNVVGAPEAGVDGGGLLREFLIEAAKAGVDPNRGLFRVDSENRIYPNPIAKKILPEFQKHFFFIGRLVGKALYSQILLDLPLAAFFMQVCVFGGVSSAIDYLATLDPDMHKNLLKLKSFKGDWSGIGLDFTIALDELGETKVVELKPEGRNIAVDEKTYIEYIHLVADYKINREIAEEIHWFRAGLHDVVPILRIFSWKEMQTLISGSDKPINVEDWKTHTNYGGGYSATHNTIIMFWRVVEQFPEEYLRKLLKFVTSCSRPPLLGFKDLDPKFGISHAGVVDRLPTSATCMNLLKLPEYRDIETLRERLEYAITAQAGFELS